MFKVKKTQTYTWPVTIDVPRDGGGFSSFTFTATFKLLPQSRIDEAIKVEDGQLPREVLLDWDDVVDEDGAPLPFSEDTRDLLLDDPCFRLAVIKAYFQSLSGRIRKN